MKPRMTRAQGREAIVTMARTMAVEDAAAGRPSRSVADNAMTLTSKAALRADLNIAGVHLRNWSNLTAEAYRATYAAITTQEAAS